MNTFLAAQQRAAQMNTNESAMKDSSDGAGGCSV
jgi:hypothetical protein